MKLLLEKISRYWQARLIAVVAGVLLIIYAVMMPVHSNESVRVPIESVALSTATNAAPAPIQIRTGDTPAEVEVAVAFATSWLGQNHAAAAELDRAAESYQQDEFPRDFAETVHRLRESAEEGSPAAQFLLGHAYQEGLGVKKDRMQTLLWYAKAGEARKLAITEPDVQASSPRAVTDLSLALDDYRNAAEAGDVGAELYFGIAYDLGLDLPANAVEAMRWYQKAAAKGSVSAANNLGVLYHDGKGMPKDDAEAAVWFERAASRGNAKAEYCLGRMYLHGDGVAQNDAKAAVWLERAAQQGNTPAQVLLSDLYATGRGVPGNTTKAYMWINLASATDTQARQSRDQVENAILPTEVAEGQKLAHDWVSRHSQTPE